LGSEFVVVGLIVYLKPDPDQISRHPGRLPV
jgi:hypothetical protein